MPHQNKYLKLISKLRDFADTLRSERSLAIHKQIDQFYYLQKQEELLFLLEQYDEAAKKLEKFEAMIEDKYLSSLCQWQKDVRWFNQYSKELA
jgi:predicted Zn-dependent peptidase